MPWIFEKKQIGYHKRFLAYISSIEQDLANYEGCWKVLSWTHIWPNEILEGIAFLVKLRTFQHLSECYNSWWVYLIITGYWAAIAIERHRYHFPILVRIGLKWNRVKKCRNCFICKYFILRIVGILDTKCL